MSRGVFVERRVTTRNRVCDGCRDPIYLSDPAISVRVSPWAYGPSTGVWQILTFCDVCGRHQRAA